MAGSGGRFWLGLDLGTNSVGWSLVRVDAKGKPCGVEAVGVRVFEAGVEGDIEQGRDASRAAVRREKRAARRMLARRARRLRKVFGVLQRGGFLPESANTDSVERDRVMKGLDGELRGRWIETGDRAGAHLLAYRLRAAAVKRPVEAFELGRAIYHLAQRRGFKSNRKTDAKDSEAGVVKAGISELAQHMQEAGCAYLGEYFATLDPDTARIRQRWTARSMYEAEFDRIIEVQRGKHVEALTEGFVKNLRRAIFRQRPLRSSSHLVGECGLEEGRKKAPIALPVAQRFRMLAAVNNLEVIEPTGVGRGLSEEERKRLVEALEKDGERTFDQVRTLLGLKKSRKVKGEMVPGHEFNLEQEGGEKRLCGNRTASKLRPILGERWDRMSMEEQERLVYELLSIEEKRGVQKRAVNGWGFTEEQGKALADVSLEDKYAAHSRVALHKLVPAMEGGTHYATAKKKVYGEQEKQGEVYAELPPVIDRPAQKGFFAETELRNPAVIRSLTEMRKVVNGIVRKYGKPELIRVELARDLKRGREERKEIWERNRKRETQREKAIKEIVKETRSGNPSREDIERFLLAEECNWVCPYTGRCISPGALFGEHSQFDVEHIIPFSISLDNGFGNKTLCWAEFNRHHKKNRAPAETFDLESEAWQAVVSRVRRFDGGAARAKLRRFQMTSEEIREEYCNFTERHLADTRHASRLAAEYLGAFYGGASDAQGKRRVQASSGSVTAFLRGEWELNGLLREGNVKSRSDHRHHAVDATVIALTSPATVKALSDAASQGGAVGRRLFGPMLAPWAGLKAGLCERLEKVVVSHRMDHRVAGPLHAETNYSQAIRQRTQGGTEEQRHVRKPLDRLTKGDVENIVDKAVRDAVKELLADGEPAKVFKEVGKAAVGSANLPCLKAKDGRLIPIRRVRVRVSENPRPVGQGYRTRHVTSGKDTLHHVAIVAEQTRKGERWTNCSVDRMEVHRRVAMGNPGVQMDWGEGKRLVMVLHKGDCVEMDDGKGTRRLYLVKRASEGDFVIRLLNDARTDDEIVKAGERSLYRITSPDKLRERGARIVAVSPIGELLTRDWHGTMGDARQ